MNRARRSPKVEDGVGRGRRRPRGSATVAAMRRLPLLLLALAAGAIRAQDRRVADFTPDPATIERHGAGSRHPQCGWIVVHVEGEPYERGYQHGRLLAREIADYVATCASMRSTKA